MGRTDRSQQLRQHSMAKSECGRRGTVEWSERCERAESESNRGQPTLGGVEGTNGAQGNHGGGGANALLYPEREYVRGPRDVAGAGTRVYVDLWIVTTPWQTLLGLLACLSLDQKSHVTTLCNLALKTIFLEYIT